jgi:hypothetical protein
MKHAHGYNTDINPTMRRDDYMMPLEILKAIELIDSKIAGLQRVRQTLLEEFGEKSIQANSQLRPPLFPETRFTRLAPIPAAPTRRDAVIKLLENEGPLSRSEIIDKSGIPKGTVATILNDKKRFISKDHKWRYIGEQKEKGLTDSQ